MMGKTCNPRYPVILNLEIKSEELDEYELPLYELYYQKQTELPCPPAVGMLIEMGVEYTGRALIPISDIRIDLHNNAVCYLEDLVIYKKEWVLNENKTLIKERIEHIEEFIGDYGWEPKKFNSLS